MVEDEKFMQCKAVEMQLRDKKSKKDEDLGVDDGHLCPKEEAISASSIFLSSRVLLVCEKGE